VHRLDGRVRPRAERMRGRLGWDDDRREALAARIRAE